MVEGKEQNRNYIKLTYGMIGGGQGAFIGDVHRKAIAMDGKAEIVAGCFSKDIKNTLETGFRLNLDQDRLYPSFEEMFEKEKGRKDGMDFVIIVTPNNWHYCMAKLALESGFHVVCDKPLTLKSNESEELAKLADEKDLLFCVTYTYTGYPIIKHMRKMIANGDIGSIRFVNAEYPQDWLATLLEKTGHKQSVWRTDPTQSGASNCLGDIGSHIENMVSYLTGLNMASLCARLDIFGEGRRLDDNASVLIEYDNGAKGLYWGSQIALGHDNGLKVRIFGSKASLEWCQENPNYCKISYLDKPTEIISRGRDKMYPRAENISRIPAGHPEGYFEAFANIYSTFISALSKKLSGYPLSEDDLDFPGVEEGLQGIRFIEKCVESSQKGAVWIDL